MKTLILFFFLQAFFAFEQEEPLTITHFTPAKAVMAGDTISIHGTGFSTRPDMPNVVIFTGGVNVPYHVTSKLLKVVVPQGASTGKITVRWGFQKTNSPLELIIKRKK